MYQLSHILIEQRNTLSTLREETLLDDQQNLIVDPTIVGNVIFNYNIAEMVNNTIILWNIDSITSEEIQNKKAIEAIKESLQGYTDSLDNKTFIHEGGLIELDADSHRPICRAYLFLFNDLLIIAKVKHDK